MTGHSGGKGSDRTLRGKGSDRTLRGKGSDGTLREKGSERTLRGGRRRREQDKETSKVGGRS